MIERHLQRLRARDTVSDAEEQAIRAIVGDAQTVSADRTIIHAGERLDVSTMLLEGIMCRYKDLRDGQRQITELHVAGDFVDLHSFTLKRLDHNIMALTPCRYATVRHEDLERITEQYPHLTRLYWFSTNLDAAIHREWEVSLGRRTAIARLAALFCELHMRLEIVGLTEGLTCDLPLTQADLAECLGLTAIHINRTLKELRQLGLVQFKGGRVTILDWKGLARIGEFDPAYLYLEKRHI